MRTTPYTDAIRETASTDGRGLSAVKWDRRFETSSSAKGSVCSINFAMNASAASEPG